MEDNKLAMPISESWSFIVPILAALLVLLQPVTSHANPFIAKAGEATTTVQVATCAVSGGFVHLYTAMDNGIFDKYGIKIEHKFISGSAMNLAALSADEVSFLYCAADGTIPGLASGVDGKLIASPLIGLPYVLLAQKDVKRLEDLKGKNIGVSRAGDLDDRLMKTMLKKFNSPMSRFARWAGANPNVTTPWWAG